MYILKERYTDIAREIQKFLSRNGCRSDRYALCGVVGPFRYGIKSP